MAIDSGRALRILKFLVIQELEPHEPISVLPMYAKKKDEFTTYRSDLTTHFGCIICIYLCSSRSSSFQPSHCWNTH